MGARLINNPRRTNIGHVEDFPVLHMRWLRKSAMFSEGQRTEGHFLYPGVSNAITIIVDLRSEHDLKVLLKVGHADSATNMQVIGLTHRPTAFQWTPVVLCEQERRKGGDAVFGQRILPDAERSRADISLPIHGRTGSSASSQAKTPSAARGYRRSRASKGTATQAGQGGTGGNSGLTGRFRIGPGASRPKQACTGSATAGELH